MASFKSYCRHQGHIEGAERGLSSCTALLPAFFAWSFCRGIEIFDAAFFNIPDQEREGWLQQLVYSTEDLLAVLYSCRLCCTMSSSFSALRGGERDGS